MSDRVKIKYWWSEDKKWFCILTDDGNNQSTVSLTVEEASLLSMNAVLDGPGVLAQGSGGCDQIALDAAHQIECLPSAAEGQEARKTALIHLIVLDAIRCASADDLQLWIRHGRVGIGQSYRQEVERARKIETERSALTSPESN